MQVKDLLAERNAPVVTVTPDTPATEASRIMIDNGVGAVVVLDGADQTVGILSERDILAAVGEIEAPLQHIRTESLMTRSVVACSPDDTVIQSVIKFDTLGIRHLVVKDGRDVVGVLSMRDVLQAFSRLIVDRRIFSEQKFATELAQALAAA